MTRSTGLMVDDNVLAVEYPVAVKVFIAGATGVIGRPLVSKLVAAGHKVTGTTRFTSKVGLLESLGARPVVLDVYDREALFAALREEQPDAVIHLLTDLASGDMAANSRIRVEGTRNLVDAALAAGVRRMVAESIAFVNGPGLGPAREEDSLDLQAPEPRRETVEAVHVLEQAVAEMPEGVVLRYGLLYGPGTMYAPDGRVAQQVRSGALPASEGVSSFLQVEDAAEAALQALTWPAGIVNVADDEPAPGTEWLPAYALALGAPTPTGRTPATPTQRGASNAKARSLGWKPLYPTWREGFKTALG